MAAFVFGLVGGICLAGLLPPSLIPQRLRLPVGAFLVGVGLAIALGV